MRPRLQSPASAWLPRHATERDMTDRVGERLALLCLVGVLLINFPILAIFHQATTLVGIPVLYLYLFGVWTAGIIAVFVLVHRQ
jgi:hypothetical protein